MLGNDNEDKRGAAAKLPSDFKQLLRDIALFIGGMGTSYHNRACEASV